MYWETKAKRNKDAKDHYPTGGSSKKLDWGSQFDVWVAELTGTPIPQRRRSLTPSQQAHLRQQATAWLAKGVIEKVTGLYWVLTNSEETLPSGRQNIFPANCYQLASRDALWLEPEGRRDGRRRCRTRPVAVGLSRLNVSTTVAKASDRITA